MRTYYDTFRCIATYLIWLQRINVRKFERACVLHGRKYLGTSMERARVNKKKKRNCFHVRVARTLYEDAAEIENVIQRGNKRRPRRRFEVRIPLCDDARYLKILSGASYANADTRSARTEQGRARHGTVRENVRLHGYRIPTLL